MGRVLVVDDEPDVRSALNRLLTAEGHSVLEAADGNAALRLVSEQQPDLVLLDIVMKGVSGLEVLRAIRDNPDVRHTRVIIVSVRGRPSDRDSAQELGINDYILKPWRDREIEMRVRFALGTVVQPAMPPTPQQPASDAPAPADPFAAAPASPAPAAPPPASPLPSATPVPPAPEAPALSEVANVVPVEIPEVPDDRPLVLVVEDEEYARLPLVDCMERAGFRTAEATDGALVLERVREMKPDIILLDLTLPRRDGFQVLRELKGDPDAHYAPVIVVTGSADRRDIESCMTLGARDYVSKPWHGGDLQHRVRRAVEASQAILHQAERAVERVRARVKTGGARGRAS